LLELASTIDPADSVTLDLESARRIGVPIVVIRSLRCGGAPFVLGRLTRREQEVARRVARGWPNKRVAADLGISLATVKDHVHHVLAKTGLASRGELTAAFPREDL
jgi:DNA-binding NarL/FixJ family response regulator